MEEEWTDEEIELYHRTGDVPLKRGFEEEFNLSEKIEHREIAKMLRVKDVKEFIEILKNKLFGGSKKLSDNEMIDIIDKLSGKELTKDVRR